MVSMELQLIIPSEDDEKRRMDMLIADFGTIYIPADVFIERLLHINRFRYEYLSIFWAGQSNAWTHNELVNVRMALLHRMIIMEPPTDARIISARIHDKYLRPHIAAAPHGPYYDKIYVMYCHGPEEVVYFEVLMLVSRPSKGRILCVDMPW